MQTSTTLKEKASGVIQLFRPELPLAAGMCVVIGELLALGAIPPLKAVGLGFACGFFLAGSALITNDYFDLEVDRINAPQRPLPAGRLSRPEVMTLGIGTALAGLAAAWVFSPLALGLSLIVWLMGFLYNWKLKAAGLWGNLIVSASVAITFILGGIVVGQPWNRTVWVFGLIAGFFDLAEEIAGDAMDAEGDQKRASQSIAIVRGKQTALRISGGLFGLVVVLSFLPIGWGELGLRYLLTISLTDMLIIFFAIKLLRSQTPAEGRRSMRGLYLSGSLGLLGFLLGSFLAA
ncbi:MAG: UbiA family prenyltransferase [Kouleothrix sp.]|nr:UbiA family prenyltransferase [Kouleothrix sp.]